MASLEGGISAKIDASEDASLVGNWGESSPEKGNTTCKCLSGTVKELGSVAEMTGAKGRA